MTIATVPTKPNHVELSTFDVDKSIAARHTAQLIQNVAFLFGKNVEHVVESHPHTVEIIQLLTATPAFYNTNYEWFYQRSPDVKYVAIGYECHKTTLPFDTEAYDQTVSGTLPAGAFFASETDNLLFNNHLVPDQRTSDINNYPYIGICDVSALPINSLSLFKLNVQSATALASYAYQAGGLSKIFMQELPQNFIQISQSPASGSADILWTTPYRRLVDGGQSTEYGFARILDQTTLAKTDVRNHWQMINHQGSAAASTLGMKDVWLCESTSIVPLSFRTPGEANFDNDWYIRTRNYDGYTGTETNTYTFAVRYKTENATYDCYLDLIHSSEPNSLGTTNTITLPASTTWTTATLSVDLRCDEWAFCREQLVKLNFNANVDHASQKLYVSTLALIENQS